MTVIINTTCEALFYIFFIHYIFSPPPRPLINHRDFKLQKFSNQYAKNPPKNPLTPRKTLWCSLKVRKLKLKFKILISYIFKTNWSEIKINQSIRLQLPFPVINVNSTSKWIRWTFYIWIELLTVVLKIREKVAPINIIN